MVAVGERDVQETRVSCWPLFCHDARYASCACLLSVFQPVWLHAESLPASVAWQSGSRLLMGSGFVVWWQSGSLWSEAHVAGLWVSGLVAVSCVVPSITPSVQ